MYVCHGVCLYRLSNARSSSNTVFMREQMKIISFYARRTVLMRGTVLCHTNQVSCTSSVSSYIHVFLNPVLSCYNKIILAHENMNFIARSLTSCKIFLI